MEAGYPVERIVSFTLHQYYIRVFLQKGEKYVYMFSDVVNVAEMVLSIYRLVTGPSGRGIGYRFPTGT
jgi:hypothetical protein